MPPQVTLSVDVLDAIAKTKLTNLGIQADKLRTKKIVIKADLQGNAIANTYKLADAQGHAVTMNERWTKSGQKVVTVSQEMSKSITKTSKAFTMMNAVVLRFAHIALSAVTRSFREAFTEMKNVDSELVVVRKVSDATAEELSALKDRAYEVGAAFGVAASDYLNAAAEMTRAGYREQAGDLAELATKLQLVGDVSQDVANQFLIATDKSYKMNGDFKKLSLTIDKLNEIDNNFATSFEKVADGIGLLAPVAAQANVSFDEMAAAIGTVTAVTQRSGTEAARALRSLFINILKDTTTEIEDGVTWTVDEINSLSDALKKYAPEVVRAAEATGELINPMEAVGALAQSYKEGLLTNQDLFDIVSGLGGKLRTSQLLALIQNWDMYNQMLEKTADAAGSADKEVANALDSWDRKLQQLKNTFTQFTQSLLDSEDIKGFIDSMNFLLKSIDDPAQYGDKFANAFEGAFQKLVERLPRIQKVISQLALSIAKTLIETIKDEALDALKSLADGSSEASRELANALPDIVKNVLRIVSEITTQAIIDGDLASNIAVALIEGIIKAIPSALVGGIQGITSAINNAGKGGFAKFAADKLANKNGLLGKAGRWLVNKITGDDLFDVSGGYSESFISALNSVADAEEEAQDAAEETTDAINVQSETFNDVTEAVGEATSALEKYKKALEGGEKGDNLKSYADAYKSAVEMFKKGLTGTNAYMSAVDLLFGSGIVDTYEEAGELLGNAFVKAMFEGGGDDYGANAANYIREHLDEFEGVAIKEADNGKFSLMVTDMEAFAKSANISVGSVEALIDALDGYSSEKLDGTAETIKDLTNDEHIIKTEFESNIDDFYDKAKEKLDKLNGTEISIKFVGHGVNGSGLFGGGKYFSNIVAESQASGTSYTNGGATLVNEEGAELIYANGKAWIAGGGKPVITNLPSGAGVFNAYETRDILTRSGIPSRKFGERPERIDDYSEIAQTILDDIPETGNNGKSNRRSLESILDELSKYIEDILKKAKEALQEQLDAIDEQIEKLKREHDAEEDANKLEELRLKILEAEKRLAEAENERTVRYINKETGQWEWMADQKAVADAQKALKEAQEAYDKEVAEQAYEAQLQALQDQKDSLNEAYNTLADSWETIYEELENILNGKGTVDIAKLIQQLLGTKGGSYAQDIQSLLEAIGAFTANPTSVLDTATTARIMSMNGATGGATSVLSAMLGSGSYDLNGRGQSALGGNTSIVGDTIYYINGVQIGSDMMNKPLSQILSVLPIYAN